MGEASPSSPPRLALRPRCRRDQRVLGGLRWRDQEGGDRRRSTRSSRSTSPFGLAIDATSVYWTNYLDGSVMKVPLDGGTQPRSPPGQLSPHGIAVDATDVLLDQQGTEANDYTDGTVMKVPLAGGSAAVSRRLAGPARHRCRCDGHLLGDVRLGHGAGGAITKAPLVGGSPITLASGQAGPSGSPIDAKNVYWTNFNDPGTVLAMPLSGGSVTTLATGQNTPRRSRPGRRVSIGRSGARAR